MTCSSYYPKCKCNNCRDRHAKKVGIYRSASLEAAKWVRLYHRPVFERLLDEAYEAAGMPRRPAGRPPTSWFGDATTRRLRLADIDARELKEQAS